MGELLAERFSLLINYTSFQPAALTTRRAHKILAAIIIIVLPSPSLPPPPPQSLSLPITRNLPPLKSTSHTQICNSLSNLCATPLSLPIAGGGRARERARVLAFTACLQLLLACNYCLPAVTSQTPP